MDIISNCKGITLDQSQREAIGLLSNTKIGVLNGAAGTGKSTSLQFLVAELMKTDNTLCDTSIDVGSYFGGPDKASGHLIPPIAFVTYTGAANQVVKNKLPPEWADNCFTAHSLLAYKPVIEDHYENGQLKSVKRFYPTYTASYKFAWRVIIIDEVSQMPRKLWDEIVAASLPNTRYYFVGDINQLPPIMDRRGILIDASLQYPCAELKVLHRQANDPSQKLITAAHAVLQGEAPQWDDPKDSDWRILGVELKTNPHDAHRQICAIAKQLSTHKLANGDITYNPQRDRILTTLNGFDANRESSMVGQAMLNDSLSILFTGKDRTIIDYARGQLKLKVGNRVMATVNESPAILNRVTNGLTGKVIEIKENRAWLGDRRKVGLESEVAKAMGDYKDELTNINLNSAALSTNGLSSKTKEERTSGPASHIVTVLFDNGESRRYSRNSEIQQLKLAYVSTTHKAQGSEMNTVIIILHHAARRMLTRENFYTAITRATSRVIVLYTPLGLRYALTKQQFPGNTLKEKIEYIKAKQGIQEKDRLL